LGRKGEGRDGPDVDEFFGFGGGGEVVDVDYERVEGDDFAGVLMCLAGFDESLGSQLRLCLQESRLLMGGFEPCVELADQVFRPVHRHRKRHDREKEDNACYLDRRLEARQRHLSSSVVDLRVLMSSSSSCPHSSLPPASAPP
jgi:hypothetical protein